MRENMPKLIQVIYTEERRGLAKATMTPFGWFLSSGHSMAA